MMLDIQDVPTGTGIVRSRSAPGIIAGVAPHAAGGRPPEEQRRLAIPPGQQILPLLLTQQRVPIGLAWHRDVAAQSWH